MKDWALTSNDVVADAMTEFGWKIVYEVRTVVGISDPDGAYSHFQDIGKDRHAECVEFLYFNQN